MGFLSVGGHLDTPLKRLFSLCAFVLLFCGSCFGQAWTGILSPTSGAGACTVAPSDLAAGCAIDWTASGIPGGLPDTTWTQSGSTITATGSDQTAVVEAAINSCTGSSGSSGKYVLLAAGNFTLASTLNIKSNCMLKGSGPATKLTFTGTGTETTCEPDAGDGDIEAVCMGSGGVTYTPVAISSGATAGSTSITLASVSGMAIGGYLVVTDTNDSWVTASGGEGNCNWCDGFFTSNGTRARGQIVEIENIAGNIVTISPGLYTAYANTPTASYFVASAKYAGLSNLTITGTGTRSGGWGALVGMNECAYCFVHGVTLAYADNNFINLAWSYRDQIQSNYLSNTLDHVPGSFDGTVDFFFKTSGVLFTNNILERSHVGIMMEWGAAGNVIAANFIMTGYDSENDPASWGPSSINMHGAHPQFNLFDSNVGMSANPDQIWGSSSHNTFFRNWWRGTGPMCLPLSGAAGVVVCSPQGHYNQAGKNSWLMPTYSYAVDISHWTWYNNFIGDIVGSANQQGLLNESGSPQSNVAILNWTSAGCSSGCRNVSGGTGQSDAVAYNFTFGFGELNDDGSGSGCNGGTSPCHSVDAWETSLLYKEYSFTNTTVNCLSGEAPHRARLFCRRRSFSLPRLHGGTRRTLISRQSGLTLQAAQDPEATLH